MMMTILQKPLMVCAIAYTLCVGGSLTPSFVSAQDVSGQGMDMIQQLRDAFAEMRNRRIMILPDSVTIDARARTATLKFENTTSDTLDAEVVVQAGIPAVFNGIDTTESVARNAGDSLPSGKDTIRAKGLAVWLRNVPSRIRLAPGEVRTVTVTVDLPPSTPAGEYSAWIVAATDLAPPNQLAKSSNAGFRLDIPKRKNGKPFQLISTVKMVYRVP